MKEYGEIGIIHSKEDWAQSLYFRGFAKWIGLSYLDYTYNEKKQELNQVLEEDKGEFSLILYINDADHQWERQYSKRGKRNNNIVFKTNEIWQGEMLNVDKLTYFCECLEWWDEPIIKLLIKIYCQNGLMKWLVSSTHTIGIGNEEEVNQCWHQVIDDLEKVRNQNLLNCGREYLEYAWVYSRQKLNELCMRYNRRPPYDAQELCKAAEKIYEWNPCFYMIENLKSKIVSRDMIHKINSISYMINCVQQCKMDSCNSFYYYRLGKQYELHNYREKAAKSYNISSRKYPLNFRALFKQAVSCHIRGNAWGEKMYLQKILDILQMNLVEEAGEDSMIFLPPMELDYAVKCYILLGNIEYVVRDNPVEAERCYMKAQRICDSVYENLFLKYIYPDADIRLKIVENLKVRLSGRIIEKRINDSRQSRKYREWRKINGKLDRNKAGRGSVG